MEHMEKRFLEQPRAASRKRDQTWFFYVLELEADDEGVPKNDGGHTCRLV